MVVFSIMLVMTSIVIILYFSKILIEINNFEFISQDVKKNIISYDFAIKLVIFNKIPILKFIVNKEKIDRIIKLNEEKIKKEIDNISIKNINKEKSNIKEIYLCIKQIIDNCIKKVNLQIELGTENPALTAILIPIIATITCIYFRDKIKERNKQVFNINPIYINRNIINIYLSGIFEFKIRHIIHIIYVLNKSKGEIKNVRTSNRKAYGYSYE